MAIGDNFFVIDSNNLSQVSTQLYGYCIGRGVQENGIGLLDDELAYQKVHGGAYVLVQNLKDIICISQDYCGCYGLYLYQKENYFAISNSFFKLVEYLKEKVVLTPNLDCMRQLYATELASRSCKETLVNEITLLPRQISVLIDKEKQSFTIFKRNTQEETIPVASEEGIQILDNWFSAWCSLIVQLHAKSPHGVRTDLSGGMDSRITLLLFLCSGIDRNQVFWHSIDDKLHTHEEDFKIASTLANQYQFSLNQGQQIPAKRLSLQDTIDISYYTKMDSHREMYYKMSVKEDYSFWFTGGGGEIVREHDPVTMEELLEKARKQEIWYLGKAFGCSNSLKTILESAQQLLHEIYGEYTPKLFGHYHYKESRMRFHFGKSMVENYFSKSISISPFFDPELQKLQFSEDIPDLIMALMFQRYMPGLLDVPFDGGRQISPQAIQMAKELCKQYPLPKYENHCATSMNLYITEPQITPMATTSSAPISPYDWTNQVFHSSVVQEQVSSVLSVDAYNGGEYYFNKRKYQPWGCFYSAIAIASAMASCTYSQEKQKNQTYSLLDWAKEYPKENKRFTASNSLRSKFQEIYRALYQCRVDIKLMNPEIASSNLQLISDSTNKNCQIITPKWFSKNGIGYVVTADPDTLVLQAICPNDGTLQIYCRARDIREHSNFDKRIPVAIDYECVEINGQMILASPRTCIHDRPFYYEMQCKQGDCIQMRFQFHEHAYTQEEFLRYLGGIIG